MLNGDSRMTVCAFKNAPGETMRQYGHIVDVAYSQNASKSSNSNTIYHNYNWYVSGFRIKAIILPTDAAANKPISSRKIIMYLSGTSSFVSGKSFSVEIDRENVFIRTGTHLHTENKILTFKHNQKFLLLQATEAKDLIKAEELQKVKDTLISRIKAKNEKVPTEYKEREEEYYKMLFQESIPDGKTETQYLQQVFEDTVLGDYTETVYIQNLYDEQVNEQFISHIDLFFGFRQFVPVKNGIVPDYYVVINGQYYSRELNGWSISDLSPAQEHHVFTNSSGSVKYGYTCTNVSLEPLLLYILESGPCFYYSYHSDDSTEYAFLPEDIYTFSPGYIHLHIRPNIMGAVVVHEDDYTGTDLIIHSHVRDNGSTTVAKSGFLGGVCSAYYTYAKQYSTLPYIASNSRGEKLKSKYGGEDFAITVGGFFYGFPDNYRGLFHYTLVKRESSTPTVDRITIEFDQQANSVSAIVRNDSGDSKTTVSATAYWHPKMARYLSFYLVYTYDSKTVDIYSKFISNEEISETEYIGNYDYHLLSINNVYWTERAACNHTFGKNITEYIGQSNANYYRFDLTDMFAVGKSSKFLMNKILFEDANGTEIKNDIVIPYNKNYKLYVRHAINVDEMSDLQKSLYTAAELTTLTNLTITDIQSNSNDLSVTQSGSTLTLKAKKQGLYTLTAKMNDTDMISGFVKGINIYATVEPSMSVTYTSPAEDIGTKSINAFKISLGMSCDIVLTTNIDRPPDIMDKHGLLISRPVLESGKYKYHLNASKIGTYDFSLKYTEGKTNTAKTLTISITIFYNKKETEIEIFADSACTRTLTHIDTNLGNLPTQFYRDGVRTRDFSRVVKRHPL